MCSGDNEFVKKESTAGPQVGLHLHHCAATQRHLVSPEHKPGESGKRLPSADLVYGLPMERMLFCMHVYILRLYIRNVGLGVWGYSFPLSYRKIEFRALFTRSRNIDKPFRLLHCNDPTTDDEHATTTLTTQKDHWIYTPCPDVLLVVALAHPPGRLHAIAHHLPMFQTKAPIPV